VKWYVDVSKSKKLDGSLQSYYADDPLHRFTTGFSKEMQDNS
jgi:hypothetical protein